MDTTDLYDEIGISFPPLWPSDPQWSWVNVHDGKEPQAQAIADLVNRTLTSSEVIVAVHSQPGVALQMAKEKVPAYIAPFILKHEIQVADLEFKHFVSIALSGVATNDA